MHMTLHLIMHLIAGRSATGHGLAAAHHRLVTGGSADQIGGWIGRIRSVVRPTSDVIAAENCVVSENCKAMSYLSRGFPTQLSS
jgi:hypothetical protein